MQSGIPFRNLDGAGAKIVFRSGPVEMESVQTHELFIEFMIALPFFFE